MKCIHCHSDKVVKAGVYKTKRGISRQRYKCKNCGRSFVIEPIKPSYTDEFKDKVVKAVVKEGTSIKQAHRTFNIGISTVIRWIKEYKKLTESESKF